MPKEMTAKGGILGLIETLNKGNSQESTRMSPGETPNNTG